MEYTEGFYFNKDTNEFICNTLEDPVRDLNADGDLQDEGEEKVYGDTAIPYTKPGKPYRIMVTYSPKFKKNVVLIMDVPEFTGVRMHWASNIKYLEGCIGVGEKNGPGSLRDTGMTDKLVDMLLLENNEGTLEII